MTFCLTLVRCLGICAGLLVFGALRAQAQVQTPDPSDTTFVRFSTNLGNIDVQMLSFEAPLNVTNFLGYVNRGQYNNSIIHRSIPGFIIQGGSYNLSGNKPVSIGSNLPTVNGEHGEHGEHGVTGFSNVRGTLAMALSPATQTTAQYDTATDNWFFNLVDNNNSSADNNLDQSAGGGPFTVFAVVANSSSLAVMDAIAAVPVYPGAANYFATLYASDNPAFPAGDFTALPLINLTTTPLVPSNFVTVNSISVLTTFVNWEAAFQSDPNATTDEAPAATPQNDSTPNLLKYFCGITANASMLASDRTKLPTVGKTTISGTIYQTLTWHERPNMVGLTIQTSTDLQTWSAATATPTQTGTDSDGDAIMQVQVLAPTTGAQFIRLSLSQ